MARVMPRYVASFEISMGEPSRLISLKEYFLFTVEKITMVVLGKFNRMPFSLHQLFILIR